MGVIESKRKRLVLSERFYEKGTWEHHGACFRCRRQGWTAICHLINWHTKSKYHVLLLCFNCLRRLEGHYESKPLKIEVG